MPSPCRSITASGRACRKTRLELEGLLDLVGAHVGILAVLQEAGALVFTDELDERRRVRLPVLREALQVLEDRVDAVLREERHGVLGVLVEVGVEDALIHEVGVLADVEEHPAEVVQLENSKAIRKARDSVSIFLP
jgi:hypothetical protein